MARPGRGSGTRLDGRHRPRRPPRTGLVRVGNPAPDLCRAAGGGGPRQRGWAHRAIPADVAMAGTDPHLSRPGAGARRRPAMGRLQADGPGRHPDRHRREADQCHCRRAHQGRGGGADRPRSKRHQRPAQPASRSAHPGEQRQFMVRHHLRHSRQYRAHHLHRRLCRGQSGALSARCAAAGAAREAGAGRRGGRRGGADAAWLARRPDAVDAVHRRADHAAAAVARAAERAGARSVRWTDEFRALCRAGSSPRCRSRWSP